MATPRRAPSRASFNWGDFALGVGAALGFLLPLGGLVGAALVSRKRRGAAAVCGAIRSHGT